MENTLTARQLEVLEWTFRGKTPLEIAQILGVTRNTIKNLVAQILARMGSNNRAAAVHEALKRGILKSPYTPPQALPASPPPSPELIPIVAPGDHPIVEFAWSENRIFLYSTQELGFNGTRKVLGKKETDLLITLARNARVHTRQTILDSVWGPTVAVEERTVDVYIRRLRQKLLGSGLEIVTRRGLGYQLQPTVKVLH